MSRFVEVAFPLPLDSTFTYGLPEAISSVEVGHRVLAPFQRRMLTGYVVDLPKEAGEIKTKPIQAVLDDLPLLTPSILELARYMAHTYGAPLGEAIQTALPPGLLRQSRKRVEALPKEGEPEGELPRQWLRRIRKSGGLDWAATLRRHPEAESTLRKLLQEEWIGLQSFLRKERAVEKKEVFYGLCDTNVSAENFKGARQQQVINFLQGKGMVPWSELRKLGPEIRTTLSTLEKHKVLGKELRVGRIASLAEDEFETAPEVELSSDQLSVFGQLQAGLKAQTFASYLLHGITGSGKTEIYLKAAEATLDRGRTVWALVPEIALTPQFVGRFRARFGDKIAVLHSGRTESERLTEWKRIRRGEATVVIGARSAVFSPLENIGLVVVDEEHDSSYKQEEGLHYHARELAHFRATKNQAVLLLGSATPSLESFQAARQKESQLLELPTRVTNHGLAEVQVVDLRGEVSRFGEKGLFSTELSEAIATTLAHQDQIILFLNRRGFAPIVYCPSCGSTSRCDQCSVSVTYHEKTKTCLCHYCGNDFPLERPCSACGHHKYVKLGVGTERMEHELRFRFPDARIGRMDRDSLKGRDGHGNLLRKLARRELDILIGTQMVTKGLDLPHVSLVGVLLADQSLHFPDFRAAERTFQLLTQVIGRSGRGGRRGQAIIQTFQPEHYAVATGAQQDYAAFFTQEIQYRKELGYPPFRSLALVELSGMNADEVRVAAQWLAQQCRRPEAKFSAELTFLGPSPAPIRMISGRTRYHLLIRSPRGRLAASFSRWLVKEARKVWESRKVDVRLDIDPYQFL